MQNIIGIDVLIAKTGSAYKLVNLAARRAVELAEGAAKLVDGPTEQKTLNTALREIAAGSVTWQVQE